MGVKTYDYLLQIENENQFLKFLQKGIISLSILNKKVYYEKYRFYLKNNTNFQAIANTAEDYNVHENTIRNAIKFMES